MNDGGGAESTGDGKRGALGNSHDLVKKAKAVAEAVTETILKASQDVEEAQVGYDTAKDAAEQQQRDCDAARGVESSKKEVLEQKKLFLLSVINNEGRPGVQNDAEAAASAKSKFLGAIDLVVKKGFVSTMELQLVSLGSCVVCRGTRTLHVRIAEASPIGVQRIMCGKRLTGRVPKILAYAMSLKMSIPRTATFPEGLCELHTNSLSTLWPASLQQLSFGTSFNQPITGVEWPPSLQQLSFGYYFDQPITGVAWPASLKQLSFRRRFDKPITGVAWPASLKQLSFGYDFNQPITGVAWPASLKQLSFGYEFNQPITGVEWPPSLQQLSFGYYFDQPITGMAWPASLKQLSFGYDFNQPITGVEWPPSLQQLSFGYYFNQPITGVAWPASLQQLSFGYYFDQPIAECAWPASLQQLTFGYCFNQPITGVAWPASLQQLTFGHRFDQQPIAECAWPASLQQLTFGDNFDQLVTRGWQQQGWVPGRKRFVRKS